MYSRLIANSSDQQSQGRHRFNALVVRPVEPSEHSRWDEEMRTHHYLGFKAMPGELIRYVALLEGTWVALLGMGVGRMEQRAPGPYNRMDHSACCWQLRPLLTGWPTVSWGYFSGSFTPGDYSPCMCRWTFQTELEVNK